MTRTSIIYGPAIVTWNSATFFTQSDIILTFAQEFFDVPISQFGTSSRRVLDRKITVRFVHSGEWTATTKAKLFPYASTTIGTSIAGDYDMVITPITGAAPLTLKNVVLTRMPNLFFSATRTIIDEAEFTVLGTDDTDWSAADSLFAIAADGAAPSLTGFSVSDILTQGYEATWYDGDVTYTGFDPFESEDGFRVEWNLRLRPYALDSVGIIDYRLDGLDLSVSCIPVGPTEAQLTAALGLQGTGAKRGRSTTSIMSDFIIQNGETEAAVFTAANMSLVAADIGYGQRNRHGTCTWRSNRTLTTGALTAAFTIA